MFMRKREVLVHTLTRSRKSASAATANPRATISMRTPTKILPPVASLPVISPMPRIRPLMDKSNVKTI